jgi:ankyrin repeat protein
MDYKYITIDKLFAIDSDSVNKPDPGLRTPIFNACRIGRLDIIKSLISTGADHNVKANRGYTCCLRS